MSAAVLPRMPPNEGPLADMTNRRLNQSNHPPETLDKRKLEEITSPPPKKLKSSQNHYKISSSQPNKSQFEGDLEKLTQDISGLKQNLENDQQWDRPRLGTVNSDKHNLCFQQIEAEEGTLHGGQTAVKLFGVTEVCLYHPDLDSVLTGFRTGRQFGASACHWLYALHLHRGPLKLHARRHLELQELSGGTIGASAPGNPFGTDGHEGKHIWISGQSSESLSEDHGHRARPC